MDNRIAAIIALLLGLSFMQYKGSASVFNFDDRMTSEKSWPVGLIDNGWSGHGSGFLIDACHVLTARHVIGKSKLVGQRRTFRLSPWTSKNSKNTSSGTVILAGDPLLGLSDDWAMMKLDTCLGEKFGFFPIAKIAFYTSGSSRSLHPGLVAMGFPSDRGKRRLSIDPSCQAMARTTHGILHDCATMPGASGGPLLTWNDQLQGFEVVGIVVAGFNDGKPTTYEPGRANVGVDLTVKRMGIEAAGKT
jgi:V8-like Glu-specific endopeptidase